MSKDIDHSSQSAKLFVFLAFAVVCTVFAVRDYMKSGQYDENGVIVSAKIVEIKSVQGRFGVKSHYPVVRFTTVDGETHTVETSLAGKYSQGDNVDVVYLPDNPQQAEIVDSGSLESSVSASLVFAAICYVIAAFIGLKMLRGR